MHKSEFENALIKMHNIITTATTEWIVIGTASLYLQGFKIMPKDIDILCYPEYEPAIKNQLNNYQIPLERNFSQDKFRSIFSRFKINNVIVELMCNLEVNTNFEWINLLEQIKFTEKIIFKNHTFSVPSKEDQIKIYRLFNRKKDYINLALLQKQ